MQGTLKTIKVDWLGGATLAMYPECPQSVDTGVFIASLPRTAPTAREGP
jgi:hypothetical protein